MHLKYRFIILALCVSLFGCFNDTDDDNNDDSSQEKPAWFMLSWIVPIVHFSLHSETLWKECIRACDSIIGISYMLYHTTCAKYSLVYTFEYAVGRLF